MTRLTAVYLRDAGCANVTVAKRTLAHAQALADEFGFSAVPFGERYAAMARAGLVFAATGSEDPVVCAEELADEFAKAGDEDARRLAIVDEAVPRDVESACAEVKGVTLVDQEALSRTADDGLSGRMRAVPT